ncbi:unnamed protein product [Timema podura]|uniref:Uncharacterized protein n=1 Tax=Timema podura TaxID=61482 RepID=A0ABN7NN16_TIMPD|nr:unnamed protein product [Timema podura]
MWSPKQVTDVATSSYHIHKLKKGIWIRESNPVPLASRANDLPSAARYLRAMAALTDHFLLILDANGHIVEEAKVGRAEHVVVTRHIGHFVV